MPDVITPPTPQALLDALTAAVQARANVDTLQAADQQARQSVAIFTAAQVKTASDLTAGVADLDTKRRQLEAIEDAFLVPGGAVPDAPTPPPPTDTGSVTPTIVTAVNPARAAS